MVSIGSAQVPSSRYQRMARGVNLDSWFEYAADAPVTASDVQLPGEVAPAGWRTVRPERAQPLAAPQFCGSGVMAGCIQRTQPELWGVIRDELNSGQQIAPLNPDQPSSC